MVSDNTKMRRKELFMKGHLACQGCGSIIAMKAAIKTLGKNTVVVIPAGCWSVITGPFPHSAMKVPVMHVAFETSGSMASGLRAALDLEGRQDVNILAWAGDGGTFDIGLQSLSGAAERNENIIYICYDNEAYMNTGVQRSSATPYLCWTTTTPERYPKETPKKDIVEIMAAHRIPYAATASIAYLDDFERKLKKAKEMKGTKFIHFLSPCPPGWRFPTELTVKVARLATLTRIFPVYEVINGKEHIINIAPREFVPVKEYFKLQGRFAHLRDEQIKEIQRRVDYDWETLLNKAMWERFEE